MSSQSVLAMASAACFSPWSSLITLSYSQDAVIWRLWLMNAMFIHVFLIYSSDMTVSSKLNRPLGSHEERPVTVPEHDVCGLLGEPGEGGIGVARFCLGSTFSCQKSWQPFLVVVPKERINTPPNLTRPAKTVKKLTPALTGGCTSCPKVVHLHISL